MPELPEVETVVRSLKQKIVGQKIVGLKVLLNKFLKDDLTPKELIDDIVGRKIDDILRIGKNIIFVLQDKVLISHLRMTGKWFVYPPNQQIESIHDLAVFKLENNTTLAFNDVRKFGTFHYQNTNEYLNLNPIKKVAPSPLDPEVTGAKLFKKISKSSKYIKTILLDQTIIGGIGNIYADEILFAAKINPLRLGNQVTESQLEDIVQCGRKILQTAIEYGGTTINSYLSEVGVEGRYQNLLQVHTRVNKACNTCQTKIKKIKVNGRGTYFCPSCQRD